MAAHNFAPVRAVDREIVQLFAKAAGGGAATDLGTPSARSGIVSVKYNAATGKYQITLDAKYQELRFLSGVVIDATAVDDWEVQVESESVASAKTINIAVFKGGTLADLTTDESLMLMIVLKNTSR